MKRSELITKLIPLFESIPKNASSYHVIDMILYKAEKLGMCPPIKEGVGSIKQDGEGLYIELWSWDEEK